MSDLAGSAIDRQLFEAPREPEDFVEVALRLPLRTEFTYRVPQGMTVRVGNRVRVPFRGKTLSGIVTAVDVTCDFDPAKAKSIEQLLDGSLVLPEALLHLARRMSDDYGCSLGEALDAMTPSVAKQRGARKLPHLELAVPHEIAHAAILELEDKHQARARVLRTVLEFGAPMPLGQVQRRTGTSDSPWKTLVKHGMLRKIAIEEVGEEWEPDEGITAERHELNDDQRTAVDAVVERVAAGAHQTFLLHGTTGSGKTEVYLRILEEVRARGKTAIVLVPEIALTPQTVGRFSSRFDDVAVLHSGLTQAQRGRQWQRLMSGRASIAIGARSALFAPVRNLGLIVIDEEQENSFKQENTPRYHAREVAIARGEIEDAVVVLGSATPTLESYGRARREVYRLLTLPSRAGMGTLPRMLVEDLRAVGKEGVVEGVVLSRTLQVLMEERLATRDQILLFLNRRGFAPVLMCPTCGTPVKCKHCDISMAFHRRRGRLICHYCCEERRRPELCDLCGQAKFHELGAGTERLAAAVTERFPDAVVARMDADTMAEREALERTLTAFRKGQIDILVGTQMIAKGHDFPNVTLVGVIAADTGLFLPDFRAAERTFQLLYQVAGRAGRAEKPGTVVLQTLSPDNYAIHAAATLDFEAFVQHELRFRREAGYPPFSRLIRVLFEARRERDAIDSAAKVRESLPRRSDLETLGPAPGIITRIKDRYRFHILAKCFTGEAFAAAMDVLRTVEDDSNRSLRVTLDVDPMSML